MVTTGAPAGTLRLNLFGGPVLEGEKGRVSLSPSQVALLGVLAVHGRRGIGRDQLFTFLWSKGTDEQLRKRLNQLVYALQQRLDGDRVVTLSGTSYSLAVERVSSDLEDFLIALRDRASDRAVSIVLDGFMAQLDRPPTPELERWIRARDLRYRSDVRTLAAGQWSEAEQRGDWAMAEEAASALVRLDPEDESALRRLLQAKALLGRVREAEAAYAGFRDLARAVRPEWEPGGETVSLLTRMEELAARGRDIVVLQSSADHRDPPLIGRERELHTLTSRVQNPRSEGFRTLAVFGEGGIGKTRLLREALARAPFDGVRVMEGRCSEFERNIPLSPLLRALSQDWIGREVRALPRPWSQILLALLPEFTHPQVDGPEEGSDEIELPTEELPRATCEAFLRLLRRLADPDPIILFFDDFHWIDATSLTVLEYVRDRWDGGGLLFVAAVRPDQLRDHAPVERWLALGEDRDPPTAERLHLGPLGLDDVASLMRYALPASQEGGGEAGAAERKAEAITEMARLVGGHPLLALEYARSSSEAAPTPTPGTGRLRIPDAVRAFVRRRTSKLGPETRRLLVAIAPSDKPLPHSVAEHALGKGGASLSAAIDEAVTQDLLVVSPRGIEFRHGLLREAIYQEISHGERLAAHRGVAEALVALEVPGVHLDIALHMLEAGEGMRATPHVLAAARLTIESGGWTEARHLLERALTGSPEAEERGALSGLLGRLLILQGDFAQAQVLWAQAEAAFRSVGDVAAEHMARLRGIEASFLDPHPDRDLLLDRVRSLHGDAAELGLRELVAESMSLQIAMFDRLRRVPDVRMLTAEAAKVVATGDQAARLPFLLVSLVDAVYGDPEKAASMADEAIEIASQGGMTDLLLRALNWKVIAYYHLARLNLPEGRELIERATAQTSVSGDVTHRFRIRVNIGAWYIEVGERDRANRQLRAAAALLEGLSAPHLRTALLGNLGQLALESGEVDEAVDLFSQCLDPGAVSEWESHRWPALAGLGLAHLHEGRLSEARRVHAQLPEKPEQWTFDPYSWLAFDARLAVASGTRMEEVIEELRVYEDTVRSTLLPSWMRLRILRFELGLRRGIRPDATDVSEFLAFLEERGISQRLLEVQGVLDRYGR